MTFSQTFFFLLINAFVFFTGGFFKVKRLEETRQIRFPARRIYYGSHAALLSFLPPFLLLLFLSLMRPYIKWPTPFMLSLPFLSLLLGFLAVLRIKDSFHARLVCERVIQFFLRGASFLAILLTFLILLSLVIETIRFFQAVSPFEFFLSPEWSPQSDVLLTENSQKCEFFGIAPLLSGTFLITAIALLTAIPLGLLVAIYLSEFCPVSFRSLLKPLVEILAGIPTIVYGFFAIVAVMPLLYHFGIVIGVDISPQSALGVGLVMGMMILPLIASLSDDALQAVPRALRENALALGATPSEAITGVVLPAALPGILASILLAIARAIGETMLVVMAAGLAANLTLNPLESVTTITVQIVSLLTGDQEFSSPKTLSAFALGSSLFLMTLLLNLWALRVIRKHREKI